LNDCFFVFRGIFFLVLFAISDLSLLKHLEATGKADARSIVRSLLERGISELACNFMLSDHSRMKLHALSR
jgi:hypothetical protein